MRRPSYFKVVEKSRAACIAAVETYNRASSQYREESFAILMINAWELLLKARIMKENAGKVTCLYEYRPRTKKDGTHSKLRERKTTRSGAPMTIGLERCYNLVAGYAESRIDAACIANIEALLEIRDSATHFIAPNALLRKTLTEISLAAVKNYVVAIQKWFKVSFSDLNIASIPISFDLDQKEVEAVAKKSAPAVSRFLSHMRNMKAEADKEPSEFSFSVKIEFDLIKKKTDEAVKATIVTQGADLTLEIDDDNVPPGFTWDYNMLTKRLVQRYSNFSQNSKYHDIRRPLESNKKLCFVRYLDPAKKSGSTKRFYNPNILQNFDAHYAKIGATLFEKEPE